MRWPELTPACLLATYRDLVILDGELAGGYNPIDTDDTNYVELESLLIEVAEGQ